jgi:hypothetical protein
VVVRREADRAAQQEAEDDADPRQRAAGDQEPRAVEARRVGRGAPEDLPQALEQALEGRAVIALRCEGLTRISTSSRGMGMSPSPPGSRSFALLAYNASLSYATSTMMLTMWSSWDASRPSTASALSLVSVVPPRSSMRTVVAEAKPYHEASSSAASPRRADQLAAGAAPAPPVLLLGEPSPRNDPPRDGREPLPSQGLASMRLPKSLERLQLGVA